MKEQYLKEFFEKSPTAYSYHRAIMDKQGILCDYEFLAVNQAYETMMGVKAADVIDKSFYEVFPGGWEGESQWKETFNNAVMSQKATQFDMNHYSIQKWIRVKVFPLHEHIFGCIYIDVTKEYMLDKEIEGFLKVNLDMLCVATTDGQFLKINKQFEHVLGYKVEELLGESFVSLVHTDDVPSTLAVMKDLEDQKEILSFVNRVRCKDGSYKYIDWRSQPNGKYIYASARDITEKRIAEKNLIQLNKTLEKKNKVLKNLAITDELTGLYNRHFIEQRIKEKLERADASHEPVSIIIFDLDHFKRVNDTWGHPVGDEVLKHTAEITRSIIRKSDIFARLGGEEFVILMRRSTIDDAVVVAEKLRKVIEDSGHSIAGKLTASFGVAERRGFESFYSLYRRADEALYRAKKGGRNRVVRSRT
ncbi:sensor domain-containing diguanylate cyclase [Peribacillus asahii]|uniref:Sensor domain-containing diguanylate cyclase n=1 Tax=Peribacillus asahii TaxID=228899 RepID=A0A398B1H3_9BACI|nr:diguanylate cyclase [Peribacillus asahii]RID83687.1 sensor domain-containing diguanylate cyclase [Peribacillus asahii]